MEEFESRLTREMRALVDGEEPSPEVRDQVIQGINTPRSPRRRWLPAAAAVLLVMVGIGVLVGLRDDPDQQTIDLATETDGDTDDADADTSSIATEIPAAVAGPSDPVPPTSAPAAPTAPNEAPLVVEQEEILRQTPPAPGPSVAPTTTVCRNSDDPACGPFRWDPKPTNQPAQLTIGVPDTIVAGELVQLTLTMSDPDGPVPFECVAVNLDRPGTSTGSCSVTREVCPTRHGPWAPPAPDGGRATTTTAVQFDETGTYEIRVTVDPPTGCDNVDPYRSGATATRTVEVVSD